MAFTSNQSVQILVIDRDQACAEELRDLLISEGFGCDAAIDAAQGLTLARSDMPSLMIVGTHLDAVSGYEFVQQVRREYPLHEIPVIFVSDDRSAEAIQASRRAGGIYFLGKPIDGSVLLELVDKALWMPHLIRRHIDPVAHEHLPRAPRVLSEVMATRSGRSEAPVTEGRL